MKSTAQPEKMWGIEEITLSPIHFNSLRLKYVLEALNDVSGSVLEVGAGAGAFAVAIKHFRPDLDITATDIDPKLIRLALKLNKNIKFQTADITKLPFPDNSFDAVVGFDVLEHISDPNQAINQLTRVLKKKGTLHLAVPLEGSLWTIHGVASKFGFNPKEKYAGHVQRFRASDINQLLEHHGLTPQKIVYSGHCISQCLDFGYFSLLSILKRNPGNTVEGYQKNSKNGLVSYCLKTVIYFCAILSNLESTILKMVPGQIGHITALK